jgi:hypothetical protein
MANTQSPLEFDDVGDAIREDRPLRQARGYRIRLANGNLDFQNLTVADPVPLGRQILSAGGLDTRQDFSLFAILPSGDFEDVRLDEPFDLRGQEAERFVAFLTDRDFKLTLNGSQLSWRYPVISGSELYRLAKPGEGEAVFLDVQGGQDQLIEPGELIRLDGSGVERFITAPRPKPTFEIVVNSRPRTVHEAVVTFEQVVQLAFPGPHEPNVTFTMTYRHATSKPHAGELAAGGTVTVKKEGTIFNVTRTVQS